MHVLTNADIRTLMYGLNAFHVEGLRRMMNPSVVVITNLDYTSHGNVFSAVAFSSVVYFGKNRRLLDRCWPGYPVSAHEAVLVIPCLFPSNTNTSSSRFQGMPRSARGCSGRQSSLDRRRWCPPRSRSKHRPRRGG